MGWHLATSLQINFFANNFKGFEVTFKILTPSNGYFPFLYKMLEKHLWNSFLLYLVVEILQLAHEISSFREALCKRGALKNLSKFSDKRKKQSSEGVLLKYVLNNFAKFTEKHLFQNLFFNKVAFWKPETGLELVKIVCKTRSPD